MLGRRMMVVAVLVVFSSTAVGDDDAPPKAVGQLFFDQDEVPIVIAFNAHEDRADRPAKGTVWYVEGEDPNQRKYFGLEVTCVEVRCNEATFSGRVYETNDPRWQDQGVQFWLLDGGTPAWNGDRLAWKTFKWPGCLPYGREAPPELWRDGEAGNASAKDLIGDLNCDGKVNFADVNPFVLALGDPESYAKQYPNCDVFSADTNCDEVINFGDINPFVEELCRG